MVVKNGGSTLKTTLESTASFPEVILIDNGSQDNTIEIAQQFANVRLFQNAFTTFAKMRNLAASFASYDWILALDADEVLSLPLQQELLNLNKNASVIYSIPFENYFQGKKVTTAGWQNKSHLRLYNRKATFFSEAKVHEKLHTLDLEIFKLRHPIFHTPYQSIEDFLSKMQRYSTLFAEQYAGKKAASPFSACLHGFAAFFKSFFIKKGILGGYAGLLISFYNGHTAFYKYLKLYHANKNASRF